MKCIFLILIISIKSFSQSISDSRSNSLSGANISDINPVSSAFNNPCGIIFHNEPILIFAYSNYTLISELSKINFAFINSINENDFAFGFNIERFGYYLYNENKISFFSAKKLSNDLELGVKTNFFLNQISEINQIDYFMTLDLGINYYLNKIYIISVFFENPFENLILKNPINNSNIRLGINYIEYRFFNIFLEYQQFFHFKNEIKLGFEYKFKSIFSLFSGINFLNKNIGFGISVDFFRFKLNIGVLYSSNLNMNISSLLSYEI